MLGEKLKELREAKGYVQRQIAAKLEVDTAYISKMEKNEKPVSRHHLTKLAKAYEFPIEELYTLWIADKVFDIVKGENIAADALKLVQSEIIKRSSK